MDSDLSHAALARFEAIEARLDALDGGVVTASNGDGEEETKESEGEEEGEPAEETTVHRGGRRRQPVAESEEVTVPEVTY